MWNHNYLKKSKAPFGCYAIYELLEGDFAENVQGNAQSLYNLKKDESGGSSLLLIDQKITLGKADMKTLMDFINKGNKVFIAANDFGGELASLLHLNTQVEFYEFFSQADSSKNNPGANIQLSAKNFSSRKYSYSKMAWVSSFSNFDSSYFEVLGSCDEKPCLIRARSARNKGELYLMSFPDAFTNYFVVNHQNRELAYLALSLIKNKTMIWDEHYKTYNQKKDSPIRFILDSDALYTAWLLFLLTLLVYMIFEGRRRQRAIPVTEPVTNTTLEFVNVISHVYFNERGHKGIAEEKIRYFYESLRKKFGVNTNSINDQMLDEISQLSGVELPKVRNLLVYCEKIKASKQITQFELAELNRQINNFNKYSLR